MTTIGDRLTIGSGIPVERRPGIAAAFVLATLAIIAAIVVFSTRSGRDIQVAAITAGLLVVLLSLRWPLLPLFAFCVLVPFEQAVFIEGIGTLSRYAEILFIVAYGLPRLGRSLIRAMPVSGWAFIAWAFFSVTWAIDPAVTWTQIPALALLFPMAIVVSSLIVDRPDIIRPLLWAYSLAATATALLGTVEFMAGVSTIGPDRATGLADQNPAYYAAILLPAVVFGLYELLAGRTIVASGLVSIICAVGIVISGTRAAWLSLIVVVLVLILPRVSMGRRFATLAVIGLFVLVASQLPGVADLVSERTDTAISTGGSGRTDVWRIGLEIFGSAPITGVGLANFSVANTPERVRDTAVQSVSVDNLANLEAHNIVIGVLGELGVIGVILLVAFLGPLVLRRGAGPDAAMVQAMLASLLVTALFLDVMNRKQFWLIVGFACGLHYLAGQERIARVAGRIRAAPTGEPAGHPAGGSP